MDKTKFIQNIQEATEYYMKKYELKENTKFYFNLTQVTYSKNKTTENAQKWNEKYYRQIDNNKIILTNSTEKLFEFIKSNYENIPLNFKGVSFIPGTHLSISVIDKEINFNLIQPINEILSSESTDNRQKTIIECLQKQLKLKTQEKIKLISLVNEGYTVGKYESASGEAIISEKLYTHFWLEYNEKKGYYLDYVNPMKIIDLDKKEA